jgi:Fe-S cluster biogenesis protein NfuA
MKINEIFLKKKKEIKQKEEKKTTIPILIYTEQTPNPDTLKFVTSRILYDGMADFTDKKLAEQWSPFAKELYNFPYVQTLIINKNFVSIDKTSESIWREVMFEVKDFIKNYLTENKVIVEEGYKEMLEKEWQAKKDSGEINDIEEKIIEIIDEHVKPWIEQDGGGIEYVSFIEGVVTVRLYGACSTCSSATVTLKSGVEQILKSMIPDVKEVAQDFGY